MHENKDIGQTLLSLASTAALVVVVASSVALVLELHFAAETLGISLLLVLVLMVAKVSLLPRTVSGAGVPLPGDAPIFEQAASHDHGISGSHESSFGGGFHDGGAGHGGSGDGGSSDGGGSFGHH